ncbi:ankyrin repeat-containing domain protein [Mycena floridula]|nr:ankyrin repeat-containing domain protein [Mycena floridula]
MSRSAFGSPNWSYQGLLKSPNYFRADSQAWCSVLEAIPIQLKGKRLQLYSELKAIKAIVQYQHPLSQDNNIMLKELHSHLVMIATKLELYSINQSWPFSSEEQQHILSTLSRLKLSLLSLSDTPTSSADGNQINNEHPLTVAASHNVIQRNSRPGRTLKSSIQPRSLGNAGGPVLSNNIINEADPAVRQGVERLHEREDNNKHAKQRGKFLQWISQLDFHSIQESTLSKRTEGTGIWLLRNPQFLDWMEGKTKLLWCSGGPGVGKTILASVIIDHLGSPATPDNIVIYIYCQYDKTDEQTPNKLLGSILKQLMEHCSAIPAHLLSLYNNHSQRKTLPTFAELMGTLRTELESHSRIYLIIDALDECADTVRQLFISNQFGPIGTIRSLTESHPLSVLVTSRDITTIAQEFTNEAHIDVRAHDEDILSYISYRIEHEKWLKTIVKEDAVLKKEIVTKVTEKAAGMFLLVQLHLDSLASKTNRYALRQALATLPKDIHRSYDDTVARIMAQGEDDANLACQVFLWLTYAKQQLTVEELQCALSISPGMTEMNPDAITDIEILTSVCAGLVILEKVRHGWTETHCPRFVHYTTQEYFTDEIGHKYFRLKETEVYFELSGKPLSSDLFAHFHIVATCVTQLAFEDLKTDSPLLRYSARFWGYHAGQCEDMLCSTPRMAALLQNHLEDTFKVPSPIPIMFHGFDRHYHSGRILGSFGLLQLTSMLGNHGVPINSKSWEKRTVLFHAVQKGHVDMVKWLLGATNEIGLSGQRLFNINDVDCNGRTLFHYAIEKKHPTIAELLLGFQINVDVADISGRTPLSYAAGSSFTRIVHLICQRADVNPNSHDCNDFMPLCHAIDSKRMENVKILLHFPNIYLGPFRPSPEQDRVDLDSPLKVAAALGYVDIVDLLLKHPNIDPNWKGHGRTPLAHAIIGGHLEVVNLLLQHSDTQPNLMSGRVEREWIIPPLSCAVRKGNMGMVKRLLQHPNVDINLRDLQGWTPLLWAARGDYEEVAEFLLQHPHIQADIADEMGRTPLLMAAMKGHESSFHLLFQSYKVTRDLVSPRNIGLLAYAVWGGNQNIIHQVLELNSSSGCKDCRLCTPLSYAAVEGYQDVVQLLLRHNDFHNKSRYDWLEDWLKRPTVLRLLLPDQKNLDPNSRHRQHFTTLINYALRWGYTEIAALLHQHVDTEDGLGVDSWK